jgi:cytochrome b involved in lipid metabolism
MARVISVQEITKHSIPEDLWIVVDDTVYDLTEFAPEHPGGASSTFSNSPPTFEADSPPSHLSLRRP